MNDRRDHIMVYIDGKDATRTLGLFIEDCTPTKNDLDDLMSFYSSSGGWFKHMEALIADRGSDAVGFVFRVDQLAGMIRSLCLAAIFDNAEIVGAYKKAISDADLKFEGYNVHDDNTVPNAEYTLQDIMHFISEDYLDDLVKLAEYGKKRFNL